MPSRPRVNLPGPDEWAAKQEKAAPEYAAERARMLFGCYPRGMANDPDTYVAAVAAVLCEYPTEVVHHLTDPRTGVARKVKFLPTLAEITEAAKSSLLLVWGPKYRAAKDHVLAQCGQKQETEPPSPDLQ